jgi:hypothetical protein
MQFFCQADGPFSCTTKPPTCVFLWCDLLDARLYREELQSRPELSEQAQYSSLHLDKKSPERLDWISPSFAGNFNPLL